MAPLERFAKGLFIEHRPASRIDKHSIALHQRERLPVDQIDRVGRRRRMQADDIGRLQ
jgi:hypothetical protein